MILRRLVVIAFSATVGLGFALHEQPLETRAHHAAHLAVATNGVR